MNYRTDPQKHGFCLDCDRELTCNECGRCREHCLGAIEGCVTLDGKPVYRFDGDVVVRHGLDRHELCSICQAEPAEWYAVAFDENGDPSVVTLGCNIHREEAAEQAFDGLREEGKSDVE